jgi:hypothetical protein
MKPQSIVATLALALATALPLPPAASQGAPSVQGEVLEVQTVEGYTYLRLKTRNGEEWAAVTSADVKKGATVTIANAMLMSNFESKSLKRRFEKIYFGDIAQGGAPAAMPAGMPATPHGTTKAPSAAIAPVAKAKGPEGRTVAEIIKGKTKLKDKTVQVRGRVVKVNSGIKGKNWLHVQDGSGAAQDGSNDLIIVTTDNAAVGDVVLVRGTVRTEVNVGAGYNYEVLVDGATAKK